MACERNCMSIAFHLSLARGINQLSPFALMKEDVLFHTQFMKLGQATRSWPARNEAELLPPAASSARQFHDSGQVSITVVSIAAIRRETSCLDSDWASWGMFG